MVYERHKWFPRWSSFVVGVHEECIMRCRFFETCKDYNCKGACCKSNSMAKNYYGVGRACGCYRSMLEAKTMKKKEKQKEVTDAEIKQKIKETIPFLLFI